MLKIDAMASEQDDEHGLVPPADYEFSLAGESAGRFVRFEMMEAVNEPYRLRV